MTECRRRIGDSVCYATDMYDAMTNGALDLTYNGTADNEYGTWNVVNGHVEV